MHHAMVDGAVHGAVMMTCRAPLNPYTQCTTHAMHLRHHAMHPGIHPSLCIGPSRHTLNPLCTRHPESCSRRSPPPHHHQPCCRPSAPTLLSYGSPMQCFVRMGDDPCISHAPLPQGGGGRQMWCPTTDTCVRVRAGMGGNRCEAESCD